MNIELLLTLLRETCTVAQVKELLKGLDLRHGAATWDDLIDICVRPAIKDRKLTAQQLFDLLQDIEEHGNQHVFLYSISAAKAREIIDPGNVSKCLKKVGLE